MKLLKIQAGWSFGEPQVRVRTDGSKLLKIQSDEVFGTDRDEVFGRVRSNLRSAFSVLSINGEPICAVWSFVGPYRLLTSA